MKPIKLTLLHRTIIRNLFIGILVGISQASMSGLISALCILGALKLSSEQGIDVHLAEDH